MIPSLEWEKNADGYKVEVNPDLPSPKPVRALLTNKLRHTIITELAQHISPGVFIVPKGEKKKSVQLRGLEPPVFLEFANIASGTATFEETLPKIRPQELIKIEDFANKYGLPWSSSKVQLEEHDSDEKPVPNPEREGNFWHSVHAVRRLLVFIQHRQHTELMEVFAKANFTHCQMSLRLRNRRPPNHFEIDVGYRSLLAFIQGQIICLAAEGGRIKNCKNCDGFFTPRSVKRETCSGACRQAWHRSQARD